MAEGFWEVVSFSRWAIGLANIFLGLGIFGSENTTIRKDFLSPSGKVKEICRGLLGVGQALVVVDYRQENFERWFDLYI